MAQTGITAYGCGQDEAVLFRRLARHFDMMPTITEQPVSETNIGLVSGNRCISVNHKTQITRPILWALSQVGVQYISTRSAGYNHIDIDFAHELGITVGNVVYSPDSVADYTLMLMLMLVRNAKTTIDRVANRDFRLHAMPGKELRDMTIGVIGTGRIGTAVIDRLQGFGCRIVAYDHHPKTTAEYVSLAELLRQSDIVTLHTPHTASTNHLLDHRRFAQMKRGAYVINTGRGALIDTRVLVTALQSGRLGGAALDVLEGEEGIFYTDHSGEPVENDLLAQLQKLPNVIITPHVAYYTDHALRDLVENSIRNCLTFERSK
jgi:D-specific alpha-keto acid dehydrogenase